MNLFLAPFINALFGFYYLLGNLGWAVVVVTILIRLILLPLLLPSLKSANKMRELQPRLKKLQEKYGKDREGLAKAQMEMYKQEGVNPLSGCLPQILQIAVLILFFSAFNQVTMFAEGKGSLDEINKNLISNFQIGSDFKFDSRFMGSDLAATPGSEFAKGVGLNLILPLILLLGSGALQYWGAKMMMPASTKAVAGKPSKIDNSTYVKATPEKSDDMMEMMRTQSLYMMPLMTIFIGWNFSLGVLIYWFVNSGVMVVQQWAVNKLGNKN